MLDRAWTELSDMNYGNSGGIRVSGAPPMIDSKLKKIWKTHSPRRPEKTFLEVSYIKPLSANPQKLSNTLKQFVGCRLDISTFYSYESLLLQIFFSLEVYKSLDLPLSSITFKVNSHTDNHFYKYIYFKYYTVWNHFQKFFTWTL